LKKSHLLLLGVLAILSVGAIGAAGAFATGNGAPSGAHYTLNLIGVPKDKTASIDANTDKGIGSRIFVELNGGESAVSLNGQNFNGIDKVNKIFLTPGDSFAVLDANATDSDGGLFQLPADIAACPTGATSPSQCTFTYDVYARALGKPYGSAEMTTCAVDPTTNDIVCSTNNKVFLRMKGKSSFDNVTQNLLTITATITDPQLASCLTGGNTTTPVTLTTNLFNPCLQDFFWNYDNNGLKLLQIRFYAES
jgi:hypothetical protein